MGRRAKLAKEFPVRRDVHIGDMIKKRVAWMNDDDILNKTWRENAVGHVVYIHPRRHFYTVCFQYARASILECFPMRGQFE